jgi:hypothetical protein
VPVRWIATATGIIQQGGALRMCAPKPDHRSAGAENRIGLQLRHVGNCLQRARMRLFGRAHEIVCAGFRIGANDPEIAAGPEPVMTRSGRQDRRIAGRDLDLLAMIASEAHERAARATPIASWIIEW